MAKVKAKPPLAIEVWLAKKSFSGKQRLAIYRKIIRYVNSGVTISKALRIMESHATDHGKKPNDQKAIMFREWIAKLDEGMPFGKAIEGWVPDEDRIVILAGETSGRLDTALENTAYLHEAKGKIKGAIFGGLAYPAFLLMLAVGFMFVVASQIVPAFDQVLPKERWTGAGQSLSVIAAIVEVYFKYAAVGFVALVGGIVYALPRWTGRGRVIADKFVPFSIYRVASGSGFLLSLAAMVKAGRTITQSIALIKKNGNPWLAERMDVTLGYLKNGENIGEALYKAKFNFPDKDIVNDLRAYAPLNKFDESLERIGRESMDEAVEKIRSQSAVLRNLSFIVLGIVFGAMYSGIASIQQQISSGSNMMGM